MNKIEEDLFKGYKIKNETLVSFGFKKENDGYLFTQKILNDTFTLIIKVINNNASSKIIDNGFKEEYTLFLNEGKIGDFALKVRNEYIRILLSFRDKCFEKTFKDLTKDVFKYVKDKYGDEIEYLWKDHPEDGAIRRKDNKKWYLVFLKVKANKLKILNSDELIPIIDIRMEKSDIEQMVDNKNILPGYHMNKNSWISIPLVYQEFSLEKIDNLIDRSYELAKKKWSEIFT